MGKITIYDLEVFYNVGVTEEERAKPQRLLISVEMDFDFAAAAASDRLEKTIDYFEVVQRILKYGEGRNWKLIEKLANDITDLVIGQFRPQQVTVEVKKFSIPQARYVCANVTKARVMTTHGLKR